MAEIQGLENRLSLPFRFVVGVFLILGLALVAFYLAMDPGIKDFRLMAVLLSFTALASVLLSYISYRLRWIHHSPSVRWTIMGAYALSSVLIFLNIWMTAIRMFASTHDLQLATILLLFATGIAMAFGYFFSSALTDRLSELRLAAQAIAAGKLGTRTALEGRDEIAELSRTFDEMSIRLEDAALKQQEADTIRRDLIAWASHDLQTPLASIRLTLEALSDGVIEEPATVARYLATAQREVSSLSNLIDDLFQLAQLDAGGISLQPGDYSLRDLVSDTLESFAASADLRQVRLSGQIEPGVDTIKMDPKNTGRVLNNLVANAVQHTPAGGFVEIRVSSDQDGIVVEVFDSGEGIQPEDLPLVFEKFFRSDKSRNRATGGAGLGLAIARGIVLAHGGRIWVESTPGEITRFSFTIPQPADRDRQIS